MSSRLPRLLGWSRTAARTALVALGAMLVIGIVMAAAGTSPQPTDATLPLDEVREALSRQPGLRALFLGVDLVFVGAYLVVFAGLLAVAASRWRVMAGAAFLFGLTAAGADVLENALLLWHQHALPEPMSTLAWHRLANTAAAKWTAAGAAALGFALAWPWRGYAPDPADGGIGVRCDARSLRWTGAALLVFGAAAFAAGLAGGGWVLVAGLLFAPSLWIVSRLFQEVLPCYS